ncbi:hypothetical protein [Prolixibacter sp. SD074]|uniref:hypothetical protein n=1 Tax=Prolixibacter sp. SD074 TaxID=2652391 RepID=UPI0012993453|nr:hypothetical protein [Prolixibacter sp. SD074]
MYRKWHRPSTKIWPRGGWLGATAIGNLIAGLIGKFRDTLELWQFFLILVVMCLVSAAFIFMVLKRLGRASEA